MHRSSIFSFDTLSLSWRDLTSLGAVFVVVCAVVATSEAVLRMDPSPKSLPFQNTRVGTLMDVLSREGSQLRDPGIQISAVGKSDPNDPSLQVLFFGSSQCAYNISPLDVWESWGQEPPVRSLNVGMPGCNIRTVAAFCDKFPDLLQTQIVVFVCAPPGMQGPVVQDAVDCPGADFLNGQLALPEQWLMQLYGFRYRRQYRDLRYQYYLLRTHRWEADLDRRLGPFLCGWRPGQGNFLAATDFNQQGEDHEAKDLITIESSPIVWEELSNTIRQVESRGAKVICLVPPQPPRFDLRVNEPERMWASFLSELMGVCESEGVVMIDHHQLSDFGDESFFDHTHLKNDDARRYSRFLGQEFQRLGL